MPWRLRWSAHPSCAGLPAMFLLLLMVPRWTGTGVGGGFSAPPFNKLDEGSPSMVVSADVFFSSVLAPAGRGGEGRRRSGEEVVGSALGLSGRFRCWLQDLCPAFKPRWKGMILAVAIPQAAFFNKARFFGLGELQSCGSEFFCSDGGHGAFVELREASAAVNLSWPHPDVLKIGLQCSVLHSFHFELLNSLELFFSNAISKHQSNLSHMVSSVCYHMHVYGAGSSLVLHCHMPSCGALVQLSAIGHDGYVSLLFGTCRRRVRTSLLRFLRFNGKEPPI